MLYTCVILSASILGVSCIDYSKILEDLHNGGLVSERVKRSIHQTPTITGLRSGGCPLGLSSSHSIKKRSLDNHLSAEQVLLVISDLSQRDGYSSAMKKIRRSVDFRQLACADGWTPCDPQYKYRTIDGRCTNLEHPTWGAALTPQLRYARPAYSDSVGAPRMHGIDGSCLPTAREVSTTVHMSSTGHMKMSQKHSQMLMLWGQFLDHDITLTPQRESSNSCCTYERVWRDGRNTGACIPRSSRDRFSQRTGAGSNRSDDFCMALEVTDDTFGVGITCIDFQRSLGVPSNQCRLGRREQINQATAYIDGSQIYGSSDELAWELRQHVDGLLNTSGHNMLPHEDTLFTEKYAECVIDSPSEYCFKAGDSRVNIQPGLASIHTLFMNEHNRIAHELRRQLPPHIATLSLTDIDEFVYQESRRIVGAILQHITYSEFLPILLGKRNMFRYRMKSRGAWQESSSGYNDRLQPGIRNEFAAFSFRVGHSLVPEGITPLNASYTSHGSMNQFEYLLMNPHLLHTFGVGDVLRGVITDAAKEPGTDISHHLEKAFRFSNRTLGGMDLIAFNIQRGRDHGIPSYTEMRKICRLSEPNTFEELDMPQEVKEKLASVYRSVKDIDAWTGATSEHKAPGAMVGELNLCILGRQFRSLRLGDRFWYEFQQPNVGFTSGQLAEIWKITLARVLCDNLDMVTVPPKVFELKQRNSLLNLRVPCTEIPSLDLNGWFTKT
ncbi:probable oxidoreductase PXDNL [Watersipora subatra]|uniref:probable oxidoreductase PXDNL n=1 Tax=Watersipora subatra TaxID=2589382 RepID=UPI00355B4813